MLHFASCMDMRGFTLVSTSKFLQDGLDPLHALEFFCTCRTCENTAIYRTGATLALKMAARACPVLLERSEGPLGPASAPPELKMAALDCPLPPVRSKRLLCPAAALPVRSK